MPPASEPQAEPEATATATAGPDAEATAGPDAEATAGPEAEATAEPEPEATAGPDAEATAGPEPEPEQQLQTRADDSDTAVAAATARLERVEAFDAAAADPVVGEAISDAEREGQLQEAARAQARSRLENTIQDTISALRATLSDAAFARCQPTRDRLQRPKLAFLYRIISSVSAETGFGANLFRDDAGRLALEAVSGKVDKPPDPAAKARIAQRKLLYFERVITAVEQVVSDDGQRTVTTAADIAAGRRAGQTNVLLQRFCTASRIDAEVGAGEEQQAPPPLDLSRIVGTATGVQASPAADWISPTVSRNTLADPPVVVREPLVSFQHEPTIQLTTPIGSSDSSPVADAPEVDAVDGVSIAESKEAAAKEAVKAAKLAAKQAKKDAAILKKAEKDAAKLQKKQKQTEAKRLKAEAKHAQKAEAKRLKAAEAAGQQANTSAPPLPRPATGADEETPILLTTEPDTTSGCDDVSESELSVDHSHKRAWSQWDEDGAESAIMDDASLDNDLRQSSGDEQSAVETDIQLADLPAPVPPTLDSEQPLNRKGLAAQKKAAKKAAKQKAKEDEETATRKQLKAQDRWKVTHAVKRYAQPLSARGAVAFQAAGEDCAAELRYDAILAEARAARTPLVEIYRLPDQVNSAAVADAVRDKLPALRGLCAILLGVGFVDHDQLAADYVPQRKVQPRHRVEAEPEPEPEPESELESEPESEGNTELELKPEGQLESVPEPEPGLEAETGGTSTVVGHAYDFFDDEVLSVVARIVDTVETRCSLEGKKQSAARVIKQRHLRRAQHTAIPLLFTVCLPVLLDMLIVRQASGVFAVLCFATLSTSGYFFMIRHLSQHCDVLLQWFATRPILTLGIVKDSKATQHRYTMIAVAALLFSICLSLAWYVSYLFTLRSMTPDRHLHWLWAIWIACCALFAWVYVLMMPCLWATVNALLRNDIIRFGRDQINQETIHNGNAWKGLYMLAQDMRAVSSAWATYNLVCCTSCVLGNFFAVLQAISTTHVAWVLLAFVESLVLLIVLLSAGLTTTAFTHETLRSAHRLLTEAEHVGTEYESLDLGMPRPTESGGKVREFIMHVQAASRVEGISVLPGHSRCTANSALVTWCALQLMILVLAKVYAGASDGTT